MRIAGWFIEGFGVFADFEARLGPGLTVVLGPNEAGKSTLLGFLRAMLFGFPNRRGRVPMYPPLRGGRHGGRLILDGPQGETIVERFAARRNGLLVNGREASQQDLHPLLGGADEYLFSSVFAFSLSEIQSFEWLEEEQIRERIFSAGIAGAGASAHRVMETLGAEAAANLRPRGGSVVKDLTARIAQAEEKLRAAQAEAERYVSLEEEEEQCGALAASLSAEEMALLSRERSLETVLELWPEYERARRELTGLNSVTDLPVNAEERFLALAQAAAASRETVRRIDEDRWAKERLRAPLRFDEGLASIADRVEDLHGKLASHLDRLQALTRLREGRSRNVLWMSAGVAMAFAEVWLAGRNAVSAGVAALLAGLVATGFLLFERAARRARIAVLEQEIAEWEDPVRQWTSSPKSGEPLTQDFLDLRQRCASQREIYATAAGLDAALADVRLRLEPARGDLARAEESLQSLLQETGAGDEAQFRARLIAFRRKQALSALIGEREARMVKPAGGPEDWSQERAGILEALREVRGRRDEAVGRQSVAAAERRRIAESAAIPAIQAELECLRAELSQAVRDWRIATLAKELVGRTLQEFTRTRQPAVLEEASGAFARITGGAYERILQEEDRESLVVVDRHAQTKLPAELSRGTAEQLYLCLRLGLASEFARRSASLPLIMDDVLVNFDPERARAVARELAHFARERQVLVFTCHPETALLFAEAAPEANTITLPRMGPSAA